MRGSLLLLVSLLLFYCFAGGLAAVPVSSYYGVRVITRTAPKSLGPRISSNVARRAARAAPRPLHLKASHKSLYRRHRHPHKSFRQVVSDVVTNHDPNEICRKDAVSTYADCDDDRPSVPTLLARGVAEIAVEAASGFVVGYLLGGVTNVRLWKNLFVPSRFLAVSSAPANVIQRTVQAHSRCWKNAKNWGSMSAVFGTFQVATKTARNNVDDEWNYIIGSAAAGACFARQEGVKAMVRAALSYGGLVYVLSGAIPWLVTENNSSEDDRKVQCF